MNGRRTSRVGEFERFVGAFFVVGEPGGVWRLGERLVGELRRDGVKNDARRRVFWGETSTRFRNVVELGRDVGRAALEVAAFFWGGKL